MSARLPLDGTLVVDLTRMLPGAVLVRALVDLGARVVKIEDPNGGDVLRATPPFVQLRGGHRTGTGFATFFRGVESVALDLKTERGAAAVRALASRADVLVESFRPGTLARFALDPAELRAANPRLVVCALPGFPSSSPNSGRAVHDLNAAALAGALEGLPDGALPRFQLADVGTGLLALSSILAALLARERTGEGASIEQPLVTGPLPFLAWAHASAAAGAAPADGRLHAGVPEYRRYRCADGVELAVAGLEPKLWSGLLAMLGVAPDADAAALAARFAERPSGEWLTRAAASGLPVTRVNTAASALGDPDLAPIGGAFLPSWPRREELAPAPRLGEHTEEILASLGV